MSTGVHKSLRRQDVTFEEKDQSLRDDVRTLGTMVGDLILEQNGPELFELVENARLRAIRRREGNEKPGEELATLVGELDPKTASQIIRAFSTYFQMVNTAEKVHRIRRRRDYLRDVRMYQPGGLEDSLIKLKASGKTIDDVQDLLNSMSIEPVFTAHPTESTRRTMLRKEQNIVKHLVDLLNPTMTPQETTAVGENAVRHRNLLTMSPWDVFPRQEPADFRYTNLLPLLKCANSVSFRRDVDIGHWNVKEFKGFHERVSAILRHSSGVPAIAKQV